MPKTIIRSHSWRPEPSSYFTCSLDLAAVWNAYNPHSWSTITGFLEHQANSAGYLPAVCFPKPSSNGVEDWGCQVISFKELRDASVDSTVVLRDAIKRESHAQNTNENTGPGGDKKNGEPSCVAMLCPSSMGFIFCWLGLIRAGYSVLIIAPQLQPAGIASLCKSCNAKFLFYDRKYAELAEWPSEEGGAFTKAIEIPWSASGVTTFSLSELAKPITPKSSQNSSIPNQVAYIFHTSGTSTGLPKPIPQSHKAAVGVVPAFHQPEKVTFSTTPLYHGGIADCFRSWASNAMILLFPEAEAPITATNILRCVSSFNQNSLVSDGTISYFSSVPYVLQALAGDKDGLLFLKLLDMVGVGGAALPDNVGNDLVSKGVNLVSRFGSAECGFLLSSFRDFKSDKAWQYLRPAAESSYLVFEAQNDGSGLSELIVSKGWPHMAMSNRPNGNFATSDLFEPHPEIRNAWRAHSRNDGQTTLITGKKFDPAPIEAALASSDEYISDVLIFGTGRQYPGVLVFPVKRAFDMEGWKNRLAARVWVKLEELNKGGQDHTRISRDMIVIIQDPDAALEKSSKGTVMRGLVEKRFAKLIAKAYGEYSMGDGGLIVVDADSDEGVLRKVKDIVYDVCSGHYPEIDEDFYTNGIDSVKATRKLVPQKHLPWNVFYGCGNIRRLAAYIIDLNRNEIDGYSPNRTTMEGGNKEMLDLVQKYSTFRALEFNSISPGVPGAFQIVGKTVILTGATGALGANILERLQGDDSISLIICLVRAEYDDEARLRVAESLSRRGKPCLTESGKVLCLVSTLDYEYLDIDRRFLDTICRETELTIIHAAWNVNFSLPVTSFESHLAGLRNLINIAMTCRLPPKLAFCSSTASILGSNHPSPIPEVISTDPSDSDRLGYSKSKWIAEAICEKASQNEKLKGRVHIVRIGQLTGDTQNGIWNMSEAWPLMLATVHRLASLPRLEEKLAWLPLDIAAQAILEIIENETEITEQKSCGVYHVVNNSWSTRWNDLLIWLQDLQMQAGKHFDIVELDVWLGRLEALGSDPAQSLIGLWRSAYAGERKMDGKVGQALPMTFGVENTQKVSAVMRDIHVVDQELFGKIWKWMEGERMKGRAIN
ncbi:hypothetical protein BGZ60DRAFT_561989 [Tricladium varicosporioides]|nr:hypothetical protein BGZ60DRAFT_561989 [Hymenoscyphus varicosporioides]